CPWPTLTGLISIYKQCSHTNNLTHSYYRTEKSYTDAHPHASFDYHEYNALVTAAFAACAAEGLPRKIIWA
ncbi:hypothetical protein, partial [Actinotignum sp. GS-2025d]|uniref:hypothetical protein n=1 Tax=Actinotignum sp. GS-2025d TaxID=3427277 RepID=UPI003F453B5D